MVTVKARIRTRGDDASIVPVVVPDIDEVREFAAKLHASKITFTPADFCIGESGIWFFSLMWEHGSDAEPVEFLDDKNILSKVKA